MVLGQILKIGSVLIKHRKAIYAVITAQDRYIKSATQYGRWSKSASYGWRSGAVIGSFASSFITNDADDSPGNGIQKTIPKQTPPSKPYQTRQGRTTGNRYSKSSYNRFDKYCRRPHSR